MLGNPNVESYPDARLLTPMIDCHCQVPRRDRGQSLIWIAKGVHGFKMLTPRIHRMSQNRYLGLR